MSKPFQRAAAGFTLIELLIVVIILAILAAIAIPQFSATSADAQQAALDANLTNVRTSLEQYRVQHTNNVYPGATASSGATDCPTGSAAGTGTAGSAQAMRDQLMFYSNAAGQTCSAPSTTYRFGPYLRQGIPTDPVSNSAAITFASDGAPIAAAANGAGWAYNSGSGQFIKNNSANDPSGKAYSAH